MPTIKTKKEMNLPELIEWITENDITYRQYIPKLAENTRFIAVNGYGEIRIYEFVRPDDVFTVEVEEEITEDTVIPKIAELNLCGYDQHEELFMNENKSIKQLLSEEETNNKAFYILNDDLTMTLIWTKEKGLVE